MPRSFEQQTGWTRPHPLAVCTDMAILARVTEFYFDPDDQAFLEYCRRRRGYCVLCGSGPLHDGVIAAIQGSKAGTLPTGQDRYIGAIRAQLSRLTDVYDVYLYETYIGGQK